MRRGRNVAAPDQAAGVLFAISTNLTSSGNRGAYMTTNMPSQTSQKRLEIEFEPADLADVTDKAVTVLKARDQVFSQGGRVVQVATVPVDVGGGSATRTFLSPSTVSTLRDSASRHVIFRNPPTIIKGKDGRQKVVQGAALLPPKAVMEALIGRQGAGLNPVMMASGSPVFRKDGTVAQANGYDASSGIYVQLDATYPAVPENPTKADALVALDQLKKPFREFPFVEAVDSAVAISAILTGMISFTLPAKPAVGVNSYVPGTGKTKLVNTISIIVIGAPLPQINAAKASAETEKRVDALLLEGNPAIGLDNISSSFGDDKLCTSVTSSRVKVRPLGSSNTVTVRSPLVFLNGNNLQPKGDFCRRMLCSVLDARVDDPTTRVFDFDAEAEAAANRPALVVAALTILRAYEVAGKPGSGLAPVGSFEEWSRRVRDALVWLGEPDVASTIKEVREGDPERKALQAMLIGWHHVIGLKKLRASDAIAEAQKAVAFDPKDEKAADLLEFMESVAGEPDRSISVIRLGTYLSRHVRRNVAGRWIQRSMLNGSTRWQLCCDPL